MARTRGSGTMGPTRSTRLPAALDEWLEARLRVHPQRSPSEVLIELIHGGLRLRDGYMSIHRRVLEELIRSGDGTALGAYQRCLNDTFGAQYVDHLERWLRADGIASPAATLSTTKTI
ncbi:MAG: hypothetical protein ABR591_01090 [Candidatus Velthaea sp.]